MKYVRNPVIDDLDVGCCFLLLTVGIWGTYCVCSPRGSFFANLNFDFIKNLKDNRLHVNCDSAYMSIYNKAVQITILKLQSFIQREYYFIIRRFKHNSCFCNCLIRSIVS